MIDHMIHFSELDLGDLYTGTSCKQDLIYPESRRERVRRWTACCCTCGYYSALVGCTHTRHSTPTMTRTFPRGDDVPKIHGSMVTRNNDDDDDDGGLSRGYFLFAGKRPSPACERGIARAGRGRTLRSFARSLARLLARFVRNFAISTGRLLPEVGG